MTKEEIREAIMFAPGVRHARQFIDVGARTGVRTWGIVLIVVAAIAIYAYFQGRADISEDFDLKSVKLRQELNAKRAIELSEQAAALNQERLRLTKERERLKARDANADAKASSFTGDTITIEDFRRLK